MQAGCGVVALITALSWWKLGGVHRLRVFVIAAAVATVAVGVPISDEVSRLRLLRFSSDASIASAAKTAFGEWHLVSLLLSFVTVCLAGVALALAAKLPNQLARSPGGVSDTSQGRSAVEGEIQVTSRESVNPIPR
jgi:hypothetical protein